MKFLNILNFSNSRFNASLCFINIFDSIVTKKVKLKKRIKENKFERNTSQIYNIIIIKLK